MKDEIYERVARPAMIKFGDGGTRVVELEVTESRMFRFSLGITRMDRNEIVCLWFYSLSR